MSPSGSRLLRALDHEYSAAISLGAGVLGALAWSRLGYSSYARVTASPASSHFLKYFQLSSVHDVVLNALMALFFFSLGLEMARESFSGNLLQPRHVVAPVLGALGGMAVTAAGSVVLGHLLPSLALRRGWGVPMATDVAFTLGILAVAGRRLAPEVRLFLLTLAISDDVVSVLILSVTGTTHVRPWGLLASALAIVGGYFWCRRVASPWVALTVLVVVWACFSWANVEPALAGVLAGVVVSSRRWSRAGLERHVTRLSSGLVLPLFAIVACGLDWHQLHATGAVGTVIFATIAIRLVGKTVGITGGVGLAAALRFRPPSTLTWPLVTTLGLLCAIGFTVPLLFATKLFGAHSPLYAGYTAGLLLSSAAAALGGSLALWGLMRARSASLDPPSP